MLRVLLVDDEADFLASFVALLEREGCTVHPFSNPFDVLAELASDHSPQYDVLLVDQGMPRMSGDQLIKAIRQRHPLVPALLLVSGDSYSDAFLPEPDGVTGFVRKPIRGEDMRRILATLAFTSAKRPRANSVSEPPVDATGFVGSTLAARALVARATAAASRNCPVLLQGERGTGKETLARLIHSLSNAAKSPFCVVTCHGVTDEFLSRDLFGPDRTASGSSRRQPAGKCHTAADGTIFLDDVSSLSSELQVVVYRLLSERMRGSAAGSSSPPLRARVIAGSLCPLDHRVAECTFRDDLYYHLAPVTLNLPPLRNRREDIPLLLAHFLTKHGGAGLTLSPEALTSFQAYSWPGNVRELESVVEGLCVLATGEVGIQDLPFTSTKSEPAAPYEIPERGFRLEEFVSQLVLQAHERTGRVKTRTAQLLGITRRQLDSRLKALGRE